MNTRTRVSLSRIGGLFALLLSCMYSPAQTIQVLYDFGSTFNTPSFPTATLALDRSGNLYGTTTRGGTFDCGVVFELSPSSGGGWTETTLYEFTCGSDGCDPITGVVLEKDGNLYGTAANSVYELSPTAGGGWNEFTLYTFAGGMDGAGPRGVILDSRGNLYGTTNVGGVGNNGTVYKLTHTVSGTWAKKILHYFNNVTGKNPECSLVFDKSGNLYGTTSFGGPANSGTAFQLTPNANGWTAHAIANFKTGYGGPTSGLVVDNAGNLYGVIGIGGLFNFGFVFELTPNSDGSWTEITLYSFRGPAAGDGYAASSGLLLDKQGDLYGTTQYGGNTFCDFGGCGTIFRLSPIPTGGWSEVHYPATTFSGGYYYVGGLTIDPQGNLYGMAAQGGTSGTGTVYEFIP